MPHAFVGSYTTIGDDNQIHMGAVVGHIPQDKAFKEAVSFVEVGNNNVIREYVTIHRGSLQDAKTIIGNGCLLMGGCHIAHDCVVGNDVIMANMSGIAGYVQIADRAILSGGAMVHQFVKIGRFALVSGNSRIGMDVPPFTIVAERNEVFGVNLVGLKRAGFQPEVIQELRKLHRFFFRTNKARSDLITEIKQNTDLNSAETQEFIDFVEASSRGVCFKIGS